jgi:drug/metabolite transporter (DMT)-like permease
VKEEPRFPPNIALLVSIAAVSTASILIKMSKAPPLTIATYRLVFATLILIPFFFNKDGYKKFVSSNSKDVLILVGVGVVLAIHFATWITSLGLTSVASSVLFVHIDPIFVALVSHFYLKERIQTGTTIGIGLACLGTVILAYGDASVSNTSLLGDLLALIGAIMLGIYILAGRRLRQNLDLVSYVTPVYASSAITLLVASLASGTSLWPYPLSEILLFFVIALVPMIFGHTVYNWTLRWLSAPIVSISLLGEPVGATILAYVILNEVPSQLTMIGGVLVLIGIYKCARSSE